MLLPWHSCVVKHSHKRSSWIQIPLSCSLHCNVTKKSIGIFWIMKPWLTDSFSLKFSTRQRVLDYCGWWKYQYVFSPYVIFESKHEHLVNRKKERVTQSKNKAKTTQIVHAPFTCYQSIQKKISDLNSIHKSTTLTCQHISLFWEVEKRAGKLDKNISPMP